ncbi:MAG TPA: hypothetical protein VMU10_03545 [Desulfomonilia bacterium]|nr:hypothetical protein [Desulfomonilia bacterium]
MNVYRSEHSSARKVLFGMLACTALLLASGQVCAKDMPAGKWWHRQKLATELKLTSNERDALDNLYAQNHATLSALTESLKKEHLRLDLILEDFSVDRTALETQFGQVEAVKRDLDHARLQYMLGVRNVLGADRYKQFFMAYQETGEKRHGKARRHSR